MNRWNKGGGLFIYAIFRLVGGGQNASFKIAAKQYLGQLMMLRGGVGQNTLLKIAAKQFLGRLGFDT